MRHADQVAYLERMLHMVRTNTRDDGPGIILTPMGNAVMPNDKAREHSRRRIPIGDFGAPEDIAYGILYLISDESRFVTGTELVIDGGMNAI